LQEKSECILITLSMAKFTGDYDSMAQWKVVGINFDHLHMGDNLRAVFEHPDAQIVGLCDEEPERMREAIENFNVPANCVYTQFERCLQETEPDIVLLCPATAHHGEWTKKIAPWGVHLIMEKPFAASLAEADEMIGAMAETGKELLINWPLAWYPSHRTTKRLVDEGAIGQLLEVHYYDGNRGPLWHTADKRICTVQDVIREKPNSWFYQRACGGGSLQDYLGYGATLGTWFMQGQKPLEVTCMVDQPTGLEVDEHSVTIARYSTGLSKFETRWGTFTDPWTHQPQPRCGFVVVGSEGTIASWDYANTLSVQTGQHPEGQEIPVDTLPLAEQNPVAHLIDCLHNNTSLTGPVSPQLSRIGQQIVDSAVQSAAEKRTVSLVS
jgi:predicted dehydrogenase